MADKSDNHVVNKTNTTTNDVSKKDIPNPETELAIYTDLTDSVAIKSAVDSSIIRYFNEIPNMKEDHMFSNITILIAFICVVLTGIAHYFHYFHRKEGKVYILLLVGAFFITQGIFNLYSFVFRKAYIFNGGDGKNTYSVVSSIEDFKTFMNLEISIGQNTIKQKVDVTLFFDSNGQILTDNLDKVLDQIVNDCKNKKDQ